MDEPYASDNFGRAPPAGGRFVKKSAAALIAKKQGTASNMAPDDVPMSSDFADPRIAAEIQQLKEREDELRKSRTDLGLPTIDDVMDTWSGKSPIRPNVPHLDHLKQMDSHRPAPITKSQSAHNIYIDSGARDTSDGYYNYDYNDDTQQYGTDQRTKLNSSEDNAGGHFTRGRQEREEQFFREPSQQSSTRLRSSSFFASQSSQHHNNQQQQQQHHIPQHHLRQKCAVKGLDITVHSATRTPSSRPARQVGL